MAMKLVSWGLVVAMLASLIALAPSITGRQKAEASGTFKLLMEAFHVGFVLYEMAAFGGETAYESIVPEPAEQLLEEVEKQGELIDEVQEGLDEIQQDLADMFEELNLYDSMQNAWNTIPNLQHWYNKLNYDIGDKPHGEVSEEMVEEWADNVLDSNNIDVAIAQWHTALVNGGVGSNQAPVLLQMRDFALNEINGTSAQSDFSTTVESTNGVDIIAERPMYFDYNGVWTGGSCQGGLLNPAKTFYFAEGTVRPNFHSYICVQNPSAEVAPVQITFMKGDGTTAQLKVVVRARSRSTVNVNDFFGAVDGPAADFSAKVESIGGTAIIAERPMYFNYNGVWAGGHVNAGVTATSTSQYFAEGTTRPGFDSFLCLQNPEERDAVVAITYMKGDGSNQVQDIVVPAHTRSTIRVSDTIGQYDSPACDFSAKVESTNGVGIVAERPMYFAYKDTWTGGHCQNGTPSPSPVQYFAEGTTRPNFDSYICVQNPGAAPAPVEITYMLGDGTNKTQSLTVPGKTRSTVKVNDILGQVDGAASDFSAKVATTDGADIIAERPMYFNFEGKWTGGHDEAGSANAAGKHYFAEGTVRPGFRTYLCIQNPEKRDARVRVTFMTGNGSTQVQDITVPPMTRYTMSVNDTYNGATLTDAYERYLQSFFQECLYYQTIGAITVCNAKDYKVPKSSSAWLNNTYFGKYIKQETDLFWQCTEQLVMASADATQQNNWNSSRQYMSLPAEADAVFANADLLRKVAMGQISLPDSGNVVSAGICGRVIGARDAIPASQPGNVPAIKVKSAGGTEYSPTYSQPGSMTWLNKSGAVQKYDSWSGTPPATLTLTLESEWSVPKYQFDGPAGGFADGSYTVLSPSWDTIGSAKVERTPFPDPRDESKTLYLSYGNFTGKMRKSRLPCDAHQWGTWNVDSATSIPTNVSTSFTQDFYAGKLGMWLKVGSAKKTYFKREYYLRSNNFTPSSDMDVKLVNGLLYFTQSTGTWPSYAYGYTYSDIDWYKDTAHSYMHYKVSLNDLNGWSLPLVEQTADAESDSGKYTKSANFGKGNSFANTTSVKLTAGHTYYLQFMLEGYINCAEGGAVGGGGGSAEVNQLIQLSTMGVMSP